MGSQNHDDVMGDEVYQPSGPDDREDEGVLDQEDTLTDRAGDPYEEGWSPPERPLAVEHPGTTAREQREGESLDQRLAEERPDTGSEWTVADDGVGDLPGGAGEPRDDEVGADRAGRLVATDEGAHEDTEKELFAHDVGIDGGAASAEEAAVHLVPDESESYGNSEDDGDPGGGVLP
ncbi:DUF5709 domain-containing protein [Streptomyces sp. ME02-8801-2C]|uniref:DUF5709 domain-containing protein n=1 Tax=Streptomyces sp. ME02-8801-2C TaxID=3028680 RepID=UPI0029B61657|nr:DUF5709 domain-containing protein [Streptomyces sp. ME02-8801-2C]MDX3455843.1 DUF5709 domain-containing protein [Streptomyces sp. ME02-8801-2C]